MEQVHHGIPTGLGIDGYAHDMIESYKVANILQANTASAIRMLPGAEVPKMLFENNPVMANPLF